ncbi:MAG: hypothetical protein IJG50_05995 [Clostridia bacterium]|nr:hypothetical protein [Clostridia bacterium]
MIRRAISCLLCALLLLTFVPAGAAQNTSDRQDDVWTAIEALEQEKLDEAVREGQSRDGLSASAAFYASISEEVEAMVTAREDYAPGSVFRNGDSFFWEDTDGQPNGYDPAMRARLCSAVPRSEEELAAELPKAGERTAVLAGSPDSRDVAVLMPWYGIDRSFTLESYYRGVQLANAMGGECRLYTGTDVTVDSVAEALTACGVVILATHGDTDKRDAPGNTSYITIFSGEGIREEDKKVAHGAQGQYYHVALIGYESGFPIWCVDGTVIAGHMNSEASAGYLELFACYGMYTDGLARPLREKGVDVISGYSQSVTFTAAYDFERRFVDALVQGKTVAEAALFTKQKMREDILGWPVWTRELSAYDAAQYEELLAADSVSFDPYSSVSMCESVAKEKDAAFLIFVSEQDSYPGHDHKDESQTVKSTWKLPLDGSASGDLSASGRVGSSFQAFFPEVKGLTLLEGSLPPGIEIKMLNIDRTERPCLTGTPTKPGYYEAKFRAQLDSGKTETRWARIYIIDKIVKTEQSETAEAGKEQTIAFSYGGGEIYSAEQISGEVPPGLAFLWDAKGARYCGAPAKPGTYRAVFRLQLTSGKCAEHTITVLVPSRIAESAESFSLRKGVEALVPLGVEDPGSVLQASLIEGHLPTGMDWQFSMSEPLSVTGTPKSIGTWTAVFQILMSDGTLLTHRVNIRVYKEAPSLEEYAVDLSGGPFTVSLEDHNTWLDRTIACAVNPGEQIKMKVNGSTGEILLDMDRDGSWDVSVIRRGGGAVYELLPESSLTGDDFTLTLNQDALDAADQKYLTDHTKKYAKTVRFHLIDRYDLFVAGTQVTSQNRTDVLGDGAFAFDGVNTLTVMDDHFTTKKQPVIQSGLKGLVIRTDGQTEINSAGPCIKASADLTISGGGDLFLTSGGSGGSAAVQLTDGARLEVSNTNLEVTNTGTGSGLAGSGTGERLSLNHSDLTVNAPGGAAKGFDGSLWLSRCLAAEPKHAIAVKPEIRDAGGTPVTHLIVTPFETKYNLEINGVTVTNRNMEDVLGDGTFTYDVYGALTVNRDYTQPTEISDPVIRVTGNGPIIRVMDDVTIEARGPCLELAANARIRTFDGTLTLHSTNGSAVTVTNGARLTLDYADVIAEGAVNGIAGSGGSEVIYLEESALSAKGQAAAVSGFKTSGGIYTSGLISLAEPEGGRIENGAVVESGGAWAKEALFKYFKTFNIMIDGMPVTELNMEDILGNGIFSFDGINTLTVRGDYTSEFNIIENNMDGLVIRVEKDVTLRTKGYDEWSMPMGDPIFAGADTTITGPGKLVLISGSTAGISVPYNASVTIMDAEVTAKGPYGILGVGGPETLHVMDSVVTLEGETAAIKGFDGGLKFTGCVLADPPDAAMEDGLLKSGGETVFSAVIAPVEISVVGETLKYSVYLPPDAGSARLIAAWYDSDGRQQGAVMRDTEHGGLMKGTMPVKAGQAEYRLFAVDTETFAPLTAALTWKE